MSVHRPGIVAWIVGLLLVAATAEEPYAPVKWTRFVAVVGQTEPVPGQSLQDEEARVAHNMKLPEQLSRREAA